MSSLTIAVARHNACDGTAMVQANDVRASINVYMFDCTNMDLRRHADRIDRGRGPFPGGEGVGRRPTGADGPFGITPHQPDLIVPTMHDLADALV
jgi:hypothetical protein